MCTCALFKNLSHMKERIKDHVIFLKNQENKIRADDNRILAPGKHMYRGCLIKQTGESGNRSGGTEAKESS